jgi:cholesterol transport system auxiliary component
MNANIFRFNRCALLLVAAGLSQLGACALVSRGDTMQVRYFTLDDDPAQHAPAAKSELSLRLGRVEASGGLSEQIAVRKGVHEISYRDDQRWTERPAQFVRRELERALFNDHGLMRSYSGATPSLEVELTELELVEGDRSQARVRLTAQVRDELRSLCHDNFETQLPIAENNSSSDARADMERSVAVLATALHKTVEQVAARAEQCLATTEKAANHSAKPAPAHRGAAAAPEPAPHAESQPAPSTVAGSE